MRIIESGGPSSTSHSDLRVSNARVRPLSTLTLRGALRKYLFHGIELRLNRLLALGDADGIVEDSRFRVVGVRLLGGLQLVQVEHLINDLLLLRFWLAGGERRHGSGCDWE